MVDSDPGGTGFDSRCIRYISLVHTHAVTQIVQIRRIKMTTERIIDSRRIKKKYKKNKETRAHSIIARRRIMIKKVKSNVIT